MYYEYYTYTVVVNIYFTAIESKTIQHIQLENKPSIKR